MFFIFFLFLVLCIALYIIFNQMNISPFDSLH